MCECWLIFTVVWIAMLNLLYVNSKIKQQEKIYLLAMWINICQLDTIWRYLEWPGNTSIRLACRQLLLGVSLINDGYGQAQPTVGGAPLTGEQRLCKEADRRANSKQCLPSWPLLQRLTSNLYLGFPWWWIVTCKPNIRFLPQSWFWLLFYHSNKMQTKTMMLEVAYQFTCLLFF